MLLKFYIIWSLTCRSNEMLAYKLEDFEDKNN